MATATLAAAVLASPTSSQTAEATPAPQAVIGMPFDGKWAYSNLTNAACGPSSSQTSHPSCHETYFGDWSVDLYGAAGTEVKLEVNSSEPLSFNWDSASGSCGDTRRIKVFAAGAYVGKVHFTHLNSAASIATPPTNGMTIGKVANLSCNPGGEGKHIHVEFDNAAANTHACYINHSDSDHTAD